MPIQSESTVKSYYKNKQTKEAIKFIKPLDGFNIGEILDCMIYDSKNSYAILESGKLYIRNIILRFELSEEQKMNFKYAVINKKTFLGIVGMNYTIMGEEEQEVPYQLTLLRDRLTLIDASTPRFKSVISNKQSEYLFELIRNWIMHSRQE